MQMVNCPRCGFSQPHDQYCARCGVDMVAYKPVQKPIFGRIIGSLPFQLLVLASIVVVVFSFARQQRRKEIADRIAEIENAPARTLVNRRGTDSASRSDLSSTAPQAAAPSGAQAQPAAAAPPPNADAGAATTGARSAPQAAQAAASESAATTAQPAATGTGPAASADSAAAGSSASAQKPVLVPQTAQVTFVTVSRQTLAELIANADVKTPPVTIGPVTAGALTQIGNKLRTLQGTEYFEVLDFSTRNIRLNEKVEFYGGQREETTGSYLGFVVELVPTALDEQESQVHLNIFRYLRENNQMDSFSVPLPETLTIPRAGAAFVAGTLFSKRPSDSERRMYDPLKVVHILSTEAFRNNLTDLLVLVELK